MNLTQEQIDIINSTGNIKINAIAGSGKTTTVIEYAKSRPSTSSILYLAFNKSVKLEAVQKFAKKGLHNVQVETAHSLAYKNIVFKHKYTVRSQGYKTHEIAEILGIEGTGEKLTEYVIANHINKFVSYFCNSNKQRVQELNYLDLVTEEKARTFVKNCYHYIETQTRQLLSKMDKGEIEITHDFYLKKFQLSNPTLRYDYILFDEGQDASPAMLDIFFKQNATKVIVGDTHQQIYGWRFAVNSLEKATYKTYNLSTSFRFRQDIANLAMDVLQWKNHLAEQIPVTINGNGSTTDKKSHAIIGRTNLGLLLRAIEYITEMKKVKHIYFEGNINSYTYADEGASLYDVLNLYNSKHSLIKDKLIKQMRNLDELEEYIKTTEDAQLSMMLEIVREYGNEIYDILKTLKEKHVDNDKKDKAEMIFSTVHRCKGMEYDTVQIVNDFITEEKLKEQTTEKKDEREIAKLNEEINLLYVAVTRTKNKLIIPNQLLPENFPVSEHILVTEIQPTENKPIQAKTKSNTSKKTRKPTSTINSEPQKAYTVDQIREKHKEAYQPWTYDLDKELADLYLNDGLTVSELAKHFGRTKGAIWSRIKKLDLEDMME